MDNIKISVLLVEDNPGDALLIKEMLFDIKSINYELIINESLKQTKEYLNKINPDVLLIDLSLPDSKGIDTFLKISEIYYDKPLIILSGNNDEEISCLAVQKGAQDYLLKGKIDETILNRSILYAIERKKLETAVKESEQKFKLLADNAPMFIWMADINRNGIYFNKPWLNYVGKSITELEGKDWIEYIHENDKETVKTIYNKAFKNKELFNVEYRLKGYDEKYICVIERGAPYYSISGQFLGFIGSSLDITERKTTEKELEKSKLKYKFLAKNSTDVIWALNLHLKTLFVSPSIKKFLGYTIEEFLELPIEKYITKPSVEVIKNKLEKAIEDYYKNEQQQNSVGEIFEIEFITKDKEIVFGEVHTKLNLDEAENVLTITGITRDITARKIAEENIKNYQNKLELLSKTAMSFMQYQSGENLYSLIGKNLSLFVEDAYIIINSINNKTSTTEAIVGFFDKADMINGIMNKKVIGLEIQLKEEAYLKLKEGRLITLPNGMRDLLLDSVPNVISLSLEKLLNIGQISIVGMNNKDKLVASAVILLKKGKILKEKDLVEAFVHQAAITIQRKRSEEDLLHSEEKLREMNISKDKLFSIISHDLRSPFQGVLGYMDILTKDYDIMDKSEIKPIISELKKMLGYQYELLEKLLSWANLQRGKTTFIIEKIDVRNISEDLILMLKVNADNKGIELKNTITEDIIVKADIQMFKSIFSNLLTNAVKFTNKGGKVNIGAIKNNNNTEFIITDNGVGMTKEEIDGLFDIDEQKSKLGTEHERGTGLGLILCKEFIEKNEGKIWVISEVNKGTEFHFTLPC
ncbi:MAG: PAS domain S-box protein [bacterium]